MRAVVLVAAALVVGCAPVPERPIMDVAADKAREICATNGHARGTPGFDGCFNSTYAATMSAFGQAMAGEAAAPRRGPTVCNRVGNTMICN